ncbi:hypothetical protein ATANTOWER_011096 [Ataeniobius toweri]|uniref:Uncharacterized protein n=1 Tax=Ataeniobius toweri TaxID=208326 RepID=A0ABU7ANJ5_9TELE|nr:hypothetical protein [Ataeniobius toweri]
MKQSEVHLRHTASSNLIRTIFPPAITLFLVPVSKGRDTGSSLLHSFHLSEEQYDTEGSSGQTCGFGHRKL